MTTTVIIEDEAIAAQALRRMLNEIAPDIEVLTVLQSVEDSIEWFQQHEEPQLVFVDIHLADGLAFRIFDKITLHCPIIFTTAYDQYALQAFKLNSIDYLLKPINKQDLERALDKHRNLVASQDKEMDKELMMKMLHTLQHQEKNYKSYFLLHYRDKLLPVATNNIASFYIDNKMTKVVTFDNKEHYIDKTLDSIMEQVDPNLFFRANRQYIVAHKAITDITYWFGNKLKISLSVYMPEKIIISKARVPEFKKWYTV